MITRSLIEFHHDVGYGSDLLGHINGAIQGKDMKAVSAIVNTPEFRRHGEQPPDTHPVQKPHRNEHSYCPIKVTLAAYEVYCHVWGPQEALITGWCRGGFGTCELIALLYARSFPRNEWRQRVDEAFSGMVNL